MRIDLLQRKYIKYLYKERFDDNINLKHIIKNSFFYSSDELNLSCLNKVIHEFESFICCNTSLINILDLCSINNCFYEYSILFSRKIDIKELNSDLENDYYSNTFHNAQWIILEPKDILNTTPGYRRKSILLINGDYGHVYQELYHRNKTTAQGLYIEENDPLNFPKYRFDKLFKGPFHDIIMNNPNGKPKMVGYKGYNDFFFSMMYEYDNSYRVVDFNKDYEYRSPLPENDGDINVNQLYEHVKNGFENEVLKYKISKTFTGDVHYIKKMFEIYFSHPFFEFKLIDNLVIIIIHPDNDETSLEEFSEMIHSIRDLVIHNTSSIYFEAKETNEFSVSIHI